MMYTLYIVQDLFYPYIYEHAIEASTRSTGYTIVASMSGLDCAVPLPLAL